MPCKPRQTPNTGMSFSAAYRTSIGHAEIAGRPGPGEIRIMSEQLLRSTERKAGAVRDNFRAGLPRIIRECMDEAVIVIDEQQPDAGACGSGGEAGAGSAGFDP